jgi:hypothetical protein
MAAVSHAKPQTTKKSRPMKMFINYKHLGFLATAAFLLLAAAPAEAGPDRQVYYPVKTMEEASNLKPGTKIAITCDKCHTTTVMTVDGKRSYLQGYKCPTCKREFHIVQHGGRGTATYEVAYTAPQGGSAHLTVLRGS